MIPTDLKYSTEHEWVRVGGDLADGVVRIGITDHAQDALGDIVFVELPEVGATLSKGESCGEVESTKSVSELFAPVSGEIVARNEDLESAPESINKDPYAAGWMLQIQLSDPSELNDLLDAAAYRETIAS